MKKVTLLDLNMFILQMGNNNTVGIRHKIVIIKRYLKSIGAL